jgi:tetratricopeptide (TPR) repeat protein
MLRKSSMVWIPAVILVACSVSAQVLAATALAPGADDVVVEVLPSITRQRTVVSGAPAAVADPQRAAAAAREAIAMARQTGETRYWGRAQAILGPWWDVPLAPVELAVLQATVQQGRHEFDAARRILEAVITRESGHAQGWLTLASLNRLSARYAEALRACDAVAKAGQVLYATACQLETQSLQGQHEIAIKGFERLISQVSNKDQASWLWSLLAESLERAGQAELAERAYQRSLAMAPDLYTAIAYSDLLLSSGRPAQALGALKDSPETDAVLLRRATAWKRMGLVQWTQARETLRMRTAELVRRGDDPLLHGRELALISLWLDNDPVQALRLAQANLQLQKEPLDWWVAVQSARQAKDSAVLKELTSTIEALGLRDQRLTAPLKSGGKAVTGVSL